ncbi:MAG: DNA polymerase III subunit delta [Candidatus Riflebacteria bacterium]|nr:DNA polymerase III subunit delta [Candidatus Riflebacteria bacterium]
MDIQSFENLIKTRKLVCPVYVFSGPEVFLKQKTFNLLAKVYVPKEEQSENVNRIICNGKELPDLINLIYSFSFNPSPRLFYIQDLDEVTSKQRKEFLEKLKSGGVPIETIIVFAVSDSKVATEINSAFKQQSDKIDFWAPFANKLNDWIRKETAELGSEIAIDAADQLIELVGSDLALLHQEITKLALAKPGSKILLADINNNVAYIKQDTPFDFLEAYGKRNTAKSLRILEALYNRGEAIQKIWFMLIKQIREFRLFLALCQDRPDIFKPILTLLQKYRLYAEKSDFKSNQEKKNILSDIQTLAEDMPGPLVEATNLKFQNKLKSLYMALNFTLDELTALWTKMIEFDSKLKSGVIDPLAAIQVFVAESLGN